MVHTHTHKSFSAPLPCLTCTSHRTAQHSPAQCLEPTQSRAQAGASRRTRAASRSRLCSTLFPALLIIIIPSITAAVTSSHPYSCPCGPVFYVLQGFGDQPEFPDRAAGLLAGWLAGWLVAGLPRSHQHTVKPWAPCWAHVPTHPLAHIHTPAHLISSTMPLEHNVPPEGWPATGRTRRGPAAPAHVARAHPSVVSATSP